MPTLAKSQKPIKVNKIEKNANVGTLKNNIKTCTKLSEVTKKMSKMHGTANYIPVSVSNLPTGRKIGCTIMENKLGRDKYTAIYGGGVNLKN